ncbi:MAG: ribbon-helix-helix domain-containing protein [Candidatus Neomarinimicrobiota bacterium]|jgi:Arc/MetJ-type ribon-helix-helix transcriptional regulator|nr:ribbon-helix-helix domain-containing protein [Methanothrix sp.]
MGDMVSKMGDKIKVTVTMDPELVEWIDSQIATRRFASKSHALEVIVADRMEAEEKARSEGDGTPCEASTAL